MRKLYLTALCCALCAGTVMADTHKRFTSRRGTRSSVKSAVNTPVWRHTTQTDYFYMDGEWIEIGSATYKYDSRGNQTEELLDEDGALQRTVTTYDSNDMPLTVTAMMNNGDDWENDSRRTYVYDPVVTDFYIERMGYDWTGTAWEANYYCETNAITRNADGNITEIVKSLPLGSDMTPAYKSAWHYDPATGLADGYAYYMYDTYGSTPQWELYNNLSYSDIVWQNTDGQMVANDITELVSGANRVKQYTIYYDGEVDGHFFAEYSPSSQTDFKASETFADPTVIGRTVQLETIDANGSLRYTISEYFDEDGEPTADPTYVSVETLTMDDHGNMVADEMTEDYGDGPELVAGEKVDYTYDADGNITEMTTSIYDYDSDEYVYDMRSTYGGYIDAGVASVSADRQPAWSVNGTTVTSNIPGLTARDLRGVTVLHTAGTVLDLSALAPGVYIVTLDGAATSIRILR